MPKLFVIIGVARKRATLCMFAWTDNCIHVYYNILHVHVHNKCVACSERPRPRDWYFVYRALSSVHNTQRSGRRTNGRSVQHVLFIVYKTTVHDGIIIIIIIIISCIEGVRCLRRRKLARARFFLSFSLRFIRRRASPCSSRIHSGRRYIHTYIYTYIYIYRVCVRERVCTKQQYTAFRDETIGVETKKT